MRENELKSIHRDYLQDFAGDVMARGRVSLPSA